MRAPVTLLAAAVVALLAGCAESSDEAAPTPSASASAPASGAAAVPLDPRTAVRGLDIPWSIVFLRGTPLVSERDGRILELDPQGKNRVVGTVDGVVARGESGLLGLAVDGSRLYAYSTGADGNRIQRFAITGKPGSFALGPPETILDGLPSAAVHDGGRIAFGPDRMLYATVGDAGQPSDAQDLESLGGKILRMTPDGDVPRDNPYPLSLVYSSGHRNPQGIAWSADGRLFATEFGQNTWDELNVITRGGNYGWPTVEGKAGRKGFIDPVQQWKPSEASPSGMAHVDGTLFLANLRGQVLRAVPVSDPSTSQTYFKGEYGRIRDVAVAPDGRVWFATSNTDGRGDPTRDDDRIISLTVR